MLRPQMSTWPEIRGRGFSGWCDRGGTMSERTSHHPIEPDAVLLDAAGVAELLGVPTSWVYAEARAGRLPNVRVGRYRRFRRRAIEDWVGAHEQGPIR